MFVVATTALAQTQVRLQADTLEVRIAEQINVSLSVSTDTPAQIQFPPAQMFMPFEVIDSTAVDTIQNKGRFTYAKTFAIIHFDTGQITLPAQKVVVDGALFATDSLRIQINDVVVDTTQQPLFPIKTILPIARNTYGWWKPYVYGLLFLLGLAGVFIVAQKHKKEYAKVDENSHPSNELCKPYRPLKPSS